MNLAQHATSGILGFITTAQVVDQTTNIPASKGEIIALLSAVVVQSAIYGITKLFSWLKKKNQPVPVATPATPTI